MAKKSVTKPTEPPAEPTAPPVNPPAPPLDVKPNKSVPAKKEPSMAVDGPKRIVCPSCLCVDYDVIDKSNPRFEKRKCRGCGFKYKAMR